MALGAPGGTFHKDGRANIMTTLRCAEATDEGGLIQGPRASHVGALVAALLFAALATAGSTAGVVGPRSARRFVARISDLRSGRAIKCCDVLVTNESGERVQAADGLGDTLGYATMFLQHAGIWRLTLQRPGYVDTTLVISSRERDPDTLECRMRPLGRYLPECWAIMRETVLPDTVEILKP